MTHRTTEQDIGGWVSPQQTFLDCAAIYEAAAEYQESILPKAKTRLEELCIIRERNRFIDLARHYRDKAS